MLRRKRSLSGDQGDLEILISDYESLREDNRHTHTHHTSITLAAVTALGGILVLNTVNALSDANRILLCATALTMSTYAAIYFAGATARQFYLRAVEAELAHRSGVDIGQRLHDGSGSVPRVTVPVVGRIEQEVNSLSRGNRVSWAQRFFYTLVIVVPGTVVLSLTVGIAWYPLRLGMFFFEAAYFPFIAWVIWTTSANPGKFLKTIVRALTTGQDSPPGRSLTSYLVWPRVTDAAKVGYYLLAGAVGYVVYAPGPGSIVATLLVWVALEPLAYQARYAWNDLRDIDEDQRHPGATSRARLPATSGGPDQSTAARSVLVMVCARLAFAFLLVGFALGSSTHNGLLLLGALLAHSLVYEAVRTVTKRPIRGGVPSGELTSPRLPEYALYLLVGLGYGLRSTSGLWFGSGGAVSTSVLVATFVFTALLGTANVTIVWLLEGAVLAAVPPGQSVVHKSHATSLWNLFRRRSTADPGHRDPGQVPWLAERDVLRSPWWTAHVAAGAAGGVLGVVLWADAARRGGYAPWPPVVGAMLAAVVPVATAILVGLLALVTARDGWLPGIGVLMVGAVAVTAFFPPGAVVVLAPPLLVVVVYLATRASSYVDIVGGLAAVAKRIAASVRAGQTAVLVWLFSERTFQAVSGARAKKVYDDRTQRARERKRTGLVPGMWVAQFALASCAVWMAFTTPILFLLPPHLMRIAPGDAVAKQGLVLAFGAAVAVVANIVAGYLSDRTWGEYGRRRPYILVGAVGGGGALVAMGFTEHWLQVLVVWCVAQAFLNTALAGLVALFADKVAGTQRAIVTTVLAGGQIVGPLVGLAVTSTTESDSPHQWAVLGAGVVLLTVPLLIGAGESGISRDAVPPESLWRVGRGYFTANRTLRPAFLTRFFFQSTITVGSAYLLYYLWHIERGVGLPFAVPEAMLLCFLLIGVMAALTAAVFGPRPGRDGTDPLARLRSYVTQAGVAAAVAAGLLIGATTLDAGPAWLVIVLGVAVMGAGLGLFGPADTHLNTEVLPNNRHHGTHLGVFNSASALPQVFGGFATAWVVQTFGEPVPVLVLTGLCALLSVVAVRTVGLRTRTASPDSKHCQADEGAIFFGDNSDSRRSSA